MKKPLFYKAFRGYVTKLQENIEEMKNRENRGYMSALRAQMRISYMRARNIVTL